MVGAIASSRVGPGLCRDGARLSRESSRVKSQEARVGPGIQAGVEELEGLVLSFGVSLGCFGYECLMSGFIWMLNAGCFIVCMLILFRFGGRLGSRAGELRGLELESWGLVSFRLVSSCLVSSRLVWGDEVGSGEYQVMGLRCRNFIFPFAILHTYPYGQRGEGLETCKDWLVVG